MSVKKIIFSPLACLVFVAPSACCQSAKAQEIKSIKNCGFELTVPEVAPARVLTIKSTSTEMMLALGLGKKIIAQAFQDGPPAVTWQDAHNTIPVISEKLPSAEIVAELQPDFIYAGWESNFSETGIGSRTILSSRGIETYVSPSACRGVNTPLRALTIEDVFWQIREVAAIFGVDERAIALISRQQSTLESIDRTGGEQTVLWYSSGSAIPYVGAGWGAPQMIMSWIGLENIVSDVPASWVSLNWETIAESDPDVIILVDAAWNSAARKKAYLRENPVTASMRAVRESRFLTIPFTASEAGVRNVDAIVSLSEQLQSLE
ncbi:ABC transporter substrate-binding protein [Labrenzia sp. DG1229]|uniref:ABC transporter substrate-binding protein n=1 Tax=Labrenzia sp. DG1229 TaxID=681847 RepID=UPI00048FFF4E|nr:ABC transporter substrate-binding protein [Labrenzia sp. DG1229]